VRQSRFEAFFEKPARLEAHNAHHHGHHFGHHLFLHWVKFMMKGGLCQVIDFNILGDISIENNYLG
jgi:hypothetical protein